jgi:predicted transcriptional regulator
MSFSTAYMTLRETTVWDLRRRKNSQAEIGRLLGTTRQASHRTFDMIDEKINRAFIEAASSNHLEIKRIDLIDGIMEAYSPIHKMPVFVSLSKINGLRVWYMHEGECGSCSEEIDCRKYLKAEASERGIKLTREESELPPTKMALRIFGRYLEDVKND